MKIVVCAAAAVVALLGDFALVRVVAVLLGVYLCGALPLTVGIFWDFGLAPPLLRWLGWVVCLN